VSETELPSGSSRRVLRSELLVVLAVSFFASAAYAGLQFVYDALNVPVDTPVTVRYVPPKFDAFAFASRLIGELVDLAPVALVAHLLARSGETMRRIGFDLSRVRRDLSIGLGLALAALLALAGASAAAHALDLPFRPIEYTNADASAVVIILSLLSSTVSAVSEEVIVNGYVLTRLGDLAWSENRAVVASALLRGSYHLYQGVGGFIYNVVGGLVAGRIFQRTKRIMPLVVAHLAIDVVAFVLAYFWPGRPAWLR
jgi:membrane protease YdiL (CAAX protease family)